MIDGAKVICVIPARAGSRRIPGKNMKLFHGKPILQYSIEAAKESGLFDEIIVSTDDDDAGRLAKRLGVTFQRRLSYLARDEVGTQEVGAKVTQIDMRRDRRPVAYVCILYATAPLMSIDDLRNGLGILLSEHQYNFCQAWDAEKDADPGQFYWCRALALALGNPLDGPRTAHLTIDPMRSCDINYPEDWVIAEAKYQTLLDRDHAVL